MKKRLILLFALAFSLSSKAQIQSELPQLPPLSDSAYASILTCGPGEEFYTAFGHSALRICDSTQGIDVVYNYGTFDFDIPHFYWTFACGNLNYCLSRYSMNDFLFEYGMEGRSVWQQRLRLSRQELNNLFLAMETNYLPEFRYYQYDFFRDNCATRVRDMVSNCLCHRTISRKTTADTNLTYRQLLYRSTDQYLLWWRFLVDIPLGMRCDKRCSNYEYMFSPTEMMHQFDTLTVSDTGMPLADKAELILPQTRVNVPTAISPTLVFAILFVVVLALTIIGRKRGWRLRWMDILFFSLAFIVSAVIVFLWAFSSHYCAKANLNILWASPLFLYFAIKGHKSNRWVVYFQLALLLFAAILTIVHTPQQLNITTLFIVATLTLRLIEGLRKE